MATKKSANEETEIEDIKNGRSQASLVDSSSEFWTLEDVFPVVNDLLAPQKHVNANISDVIVVLDTNALLLPFRVGKQEIPEIIQAYEKLIADKRLYVPARAIREFVRNRDGRLAEFVKTLRDHGSAAVVSRIEIPSLLDGLPERQAVADASASMEIARKAYMSALSKLGDLVRAWRGNDPVTSMYYQLFKGDVILDAVDDRKKIEKEWQLRLRRKIPPGYKDGAKSDTGIGDFLIWLSILKLGELHKRDLIFVTGEEKPDWFVRADGQGIYPRPELIDEYRRASKGKNLRLSKLADVLSDMQVSTAVVTEVREAEIAANAAARNAVTEQNDVANSIRTISMPIQRGDINFDYSTNDGIVIITTVEGDFPIRFGKASRSSIYLYRSGNTARIARAKQALPGDVVDFNWFDSSSRVYEIHLGEAFLAQNDRGNTIAGRVKHISNDNRGDREDKVIFSYNLFPPSSLVEIP